MSKELYLMYFVNQFDEHILQVIFDSKEKAENAIIEARERRIKDNMYLVDDSFYIERMYLN